MARLGKRRVAVIVAAVLAVLAFMIPFLWRVPPFQVPPEPTDSVAPSSALTLTGDRGNNDWFKGPVSARITATDDRQVSAIHYQLSGRSEQSVNGAEASFMIEGNGRHTVRFWAVDVAGNRESVKTREMGVDGLTPSVEVETRGIHSGTQPWYLSTVNVTVISDDGTDGSGIARVTYQIEEMDLVSSNSARVSFLVSDEGNNAVTYTVEDNAGNAASSQTFINIDRTVLPTDITFEGLLGQNGWYKSPVNVTITSTDEDVNMIHYEVLHIQTMMNATNDFDGSIVSFILPDEFSLGEGNYNVTAWTVDIADNVGNAKIAPVAIDITGVLVVDLSTIEDRSYWRELVSEEPNLNVTVRYSIHTVSNLVEASSKFVREGIGGPETIMALNDTMYDLRDNSTFKPGRYRLEVEARNMAGHNATVLLAQFAIRDFMDTLSECNFPNDGLAQSLTVKIQHALERLNVGDETTGDNVLKAARNEAQASSIENSDPACAAALQETIDDRLGPESSSPTIISASM